MVKMLLTKIWFVSLGLLLASLIVSPHVIAETQSPPKGPTEEQLSKKKWAVIEGFRSAKFGMNEKQLLRAIAKDFKISSNKVKRVFNSEVKTNNLIIRVPNLLKNGETADIVFILGYKSKKLIHVNIDWGKNVVDNFDPDTVLGSANLLNVFFRGKRYKRAGYVVNHQLNDRELIVFRGRDQKNRTVLLRFITPDPKQGEDFMEARKSVSLILSYILNVNKPDVFQSKQK